jgi:diaminopimelate epimerase
MLSVAISIAVHNPTAPSRGRMRLPLRGVPAAPRRTVASLAVSTPRSGVASSFLERRESERALHFVKYQGLGNDFIMVRLFPFPNSLQLFRVVQCSFGW